MANPYVMVQSRAIPVEMSDAFDRTVVIALTTLLRNRYGPVGPVKAVLGQVGDWSTIGQTRTLKMVGGRMDEEFTMLDRPNTFG
ncbi:MAG: SRPBCC family protein, partial [Mycobacterium sp.]